MPKHFDNFNYRKAEADLMDNGDRMPENIYGIRNEKSLRSYLKEHDLNPDKYFSPKPSTDNSTSDKSDSGCYLTTACTAFRGLPDRCMELETLRAYRDGYLSHREGGEAEIDRYYTMAPNIVRSINRREDATAIWNDVYEGLVAPCVAMIQENRNEEAYTLYKSYSMSLYEKYVRN